MHCGHGDWEVVMLYVSFSIDLSLQAEKWMKVSVQTEYCSQNANNIDNKWGLLELRQYNVQKCFKM